MILNKNKTLSEGKQNVNELEQESKDEIAASVRKIIAKEKEETSRKRICSNEKED